MNRARRDPIGAWTDLSAAASRSTGYRPVVRPTVASHWSGVGSLGVMTVALIAIVTALVLRPESGPAAAGPVTAAVDDGMFRLDLTTPRGTYGPGEAIEPVARVTYLGPDAVLAIHHATSPVQFRIEKVGGGRAMEGATRMPCLRTNLTRDVPLTFPFLKSGNPATGFDRAWYEDPTLTLPVGTWRIIVDLSVSVGGCGDKRPPLTTENVIHVIEPTGDRSVVDRAHDGEFRLELATPRRTYASGEAIETTATVTYLGPLEETTIAYGGSMVGFAIDEVGGQRGMGGGMTAQCQSSSIRRDAPLAVLLQKSGAIGEAGFDRAWFEDPVLRLPAGTWRIRAYLAISTSDGTSICPGRAHALKVQNVITVIDREPPDASASTSESVSPSATPEASPSAEPVPSVGPVEATTDDGTFRLDLVTPRSALGPAEAIETVARVTYLGPDAETSMFHAASPVGFLIEEIGGDRRMDGGMDVPCLNTTVEKDRPISYAFEKAGTIDGSGFDRAWFEDPVLRLPVGTWRIRAYLDIYLASCGGDNHRLEVENVIVVR